MDNNMKARQARRLGLETKSTENKHPAKKANRKHRVLKFEQRIFEKYEESEKYEEFNILL